MPVSCLFFIAIDMGGDLGCHHGTVNMKLYMKRNGVSNYMYMYKITWYCIYQMNDYGRGSAVRGRLDKTVFVKCYPDDPD